MKHEYCKNYRNMHIQNPFCKKIKIEKGLSVEHE